MAQNNHYNHLACPVLLWAYSRTNNSVSASGTDITERGVNLLRTHRT